MKKWVAGLLLALSLSFVLQPTAAQFGACLPAFCNNPPVSQCTEATAFLARTSGVDTLHQNAYKNLICGLVSDGVWPKFDVLYVWATQNQTTALLNLRQNLYNGTLHGSPPFMADVGFTGIAASTADYIDTGFNSTTASSPQYVQDSAHISEWNLSNLSLNCASGGAATGSVAQYIIPRAPGGGLSYARINSDPSLGLFTGIGGPLGHFVDSRTSNTFVTGFQNGVVWGAGNSPSVGLINLNMYSLGTNNSGTAGGCEKQIALFSLGAGFTDPESVLYYNRARTYMTTVGLP